MKLSLLWGDISTSTTDVVVNAANEWLDDGGGVAGAIWEYGGKTLQDECRKFQYCPPGNIVATTPGNLKCKQVIHAVGKPYNSARVAWMNATYFNLYRMCIEATLRSQYVSIAFPLLGTGAYNFPFYSSLDALNRAIDEFNGTPLDINLYLYTFDEYMRARGYLSLGGELPVHQVQPARVLSKSSSGYSLKRQPTSTGGLEIGDYPYGN